MQSATNPLIHVHTDQDAVKVKAASCGEDIVVPEVPCITVVNDFDGAIIERGRRIKLRGDWVVRQYRNPVPCGATTVFVPQQGAEYEMEVHE